MVIMKEKTLEHSNAGHLDCFENTETKQALKSLLRLTLEKDFNKKISHTAHEIRNPLSAMELHSKIISKRLENIDETSVDSIKSSVDCILNSIEVLKSITDGLKNFSKDIELNFGKTDITSTVSNAVKTIKPAFDSKKIRLNLPVTNCIICEYDAHKTHQIIYNLLKNALEASKKGDCVDIYFIEKEKDLSILVRDSGCGIKKENIEKIFLPKFTTKKTGSGIGLCESKKLANAQNGDLRLISTSEKGSIFEFVLPLKKEDGKCIL